MTTSDTPETSDATVTAGLLVIGDEILSGRTKDRNIGTIAEHLTGIGIALSEVRVVGDSEQDIAAAVNALRSRYTYVFTTGGIGPTHDDITADSIGAAFGVAVDVDPRAVAMMEPVYAARGIPLTPARLRMARVPAGAELIANRVSAAPGFRIGNVFVLAGVPDIMKSMLDAATEQLRTGPKMHSVSIVLSKPEGEIAELFAAHQSAYPDIAMGSYPSFENGRYRTELVLRGVDPARLEDARSGLANTLAERELL
ncbi:MAG: competence/damage-inducible protein A [Hyphomicrobium sp.]|jgi:molybdenum cofactor synthesis domain-containing protein|uniref:competence/damage-inducible protein A n=1 Tax=Hyphomicrobium sp. TaxID=82 RepID=UPI0025B7EBBE|nr:molybdopterin-binding protein [Hyphomicrobium sp.]MBX9862665.1 competence/damage-inducible protein A [Hyphomicrobium sp.]